MSGLILKDFFIVRQQFKTQAIIMAVYALVFLPQTGGSMTFPVVSTIMCGGLFVSCMSYDEQVKWDSYALTMPLSRKSIVLSRYIFSVILAFIGAILSLLIVFVASFIKQGISIPQALAAAAGGILFSALTSGIMMPLLYKLGVEKARILMVITYLLPAGLIVGIVFLLNKLNLATPSLPVIIGLCIGIAVVVLSFFAFSIWLSIKIFTNKEF